jgi:hypothetical protein
MAPGGPGPKVSRAFWPAPSPRRSQLGPTILALTGTWWFGIKILLSNFAFVLGDVSAELEPAKRCSRIGARWMVAWRMAYAACCMLHDGWAFVACCTVNRHAIASVGMRDAVDALNVEQRTTAAWHMWSATRQRRRSMRLKTLNDVRRGTNRRNAAGAHAAGAMQRAHVQRAHMQRAQCSGRQTRQQPTLRASSATRRCTAFRAERGHSGRHHPMG